MRIAFIITFLLASFSAFAQKDLRYRAELKLAKNYPAKDFKDSIKCNDLIILKSDRITVYTKIDVTKFDVYRTSKVENFPEMLIMDSIDGDGDEVVIVSDTKEVKDRITFTFNYSKFTVKLITKKIE